MSGLSGGKLVWSIYLQKKLTWLGRWHYINIILWLWVCDTAQQHKPSSIFLFWVIWWKLFCCIIAKYIWGIAVVRGSGMGQDCGKLPNMVNQQKYLTRTEMVYSSKNGMVITTKAYQAVPARKNYPFKNSMFCCKPELQTSNFPVMKLDEVVSNSQNLSQSKN